LDHPTASDEESERGQDCPCTPPTKRVFPGTPYNSPVATSSGGSDTEVDTPSRRRIPIKLPEEVAPLLIVTDFSAGNDRVIDALKRTRVAGDVVRVEAGWDIKVALDTQPRGVLFLLRHEGSQFTIVTNTGAEVTVADHDMVRMIKCSKNGGLSVDCVLFMGVGTTDVAKRVVAATNVPTALGLTTPVPDKDYPCRRIVRDTFLLVSYVFVKSLQKGASIASATENARFVLPNFQLPGKYLHLAGHMETTTMMKAGGFVNHCTKTHVTRADVSAWVREACDIRDGVLPEPEPEAPAGAGAGAGVEPYYNDSDDDSV